MMGLAFSGMGAGVLVMGPLAQWLIAGHGWRAAYLVLGVGTLVVLMPLDLARRARGARPQRAAAQRRAGRPATAGDRARRGRRRAAHARVLGALLRLPLHAARRLLGRHAPGGLRGGPRFPAPVRGRHLRPHRAALGRGPDRLRHRGRPDRSRHVGDDLLRLHRGWARCACSGSSVAARRARSTPMRCSSASASAPAARSSPRSPRSSSTGRRFGVIYGFLSVGNGIGGGVAPWFGGFVHDVTGSYRIAFLIAVGFCAVGSACFWLARPPRRDR